MQITIAWLWATTPVASVAAAVVAFITIGFALGWIVAGYENGEI